MWLHYFEVRYTLAIHVYKHKKNYKIKFVKFVKKIDKYKMKINF